MTANNPFSHIRVVFRRSTTLTKVVVLACVVLCIAALLALHFQIQKTAAQAEALRSQAVSLEQENSQLNDRLENLDTVEGILQIAEDELGLTDPDTVIFTPAH